MSATFKTLLAKLALALLFLSGCAGMPSGPGSPSREIPAPRSAYPEPAEPEIVEGPSPRTLASLRLTEEARLLLNAKQPDEAIRTLERALNIDPGNGRNYYYLAEAWLMKGNGAQARELNRLAEIYLENDPQWKEKVRRQKERIEDSF